MKIILKIILTLFGFKFVHILRRLKLFISSPVLFLKELHVDIKKDTKFKKKSSQIIWCAGLPKSGSTLIEQILDETNFVDLGKSSLRWFNNFNLDNPHGISNQMFLNAPKNGLSFIKTHTHYSKKYLSIAKRHNIKIIVSLRDLRDTLVSQVYHIKLDKKHHKHKYLKNLNFENSLIYLIKSTFIVNGKKNKTLLYYYNWIKEWKLLKDKNIIFLWYEDYLKNPKRYIKKILNFINEKQNSHQKIFKKIKTKSKFQKNLFLKRLNSLGRSKSTFREGKMGYYKIYFTQRVEKEFYKIISKKMLRNVLYK
jgi:hypothetical protein